MSVSIANASGHASVIPTLATFPVNQWYVAALAWELKDTPLARTLLGNPVVLFRCADGSVAALQDRCCHRELPLSNGTLEEGGLRCGYHGLFSMLKASASKCPAKSESRARH